MKQINVNDLWEKQWYLAYAFFKTKGNLKTKARLKDKWNKAFKKMLFDIEKDITENLTAKEAKQ